MCSHCDANEYREAIAENVRAAQKREPLPGLPTPEKDARFSASLIEADVLNKAIGWRLLLRVHDHVWRDREWEWRTRFDVTALLWNKAIALCKERIVGRAA